MANEGVFNELNLNPLIVVEEDDGVDTSSSNTTDDDSQDGEDQGQGNQNQRNQNNNNQITDATFEVEEDDEDETPLRRTQGSEEGNEESGDDTDEGLKQWTTFYREKGLISEDVKDEDITNIESLFEKLQEQQLATANSLLDSYKAQLPKEIKDLLDVWEDGAEGEAFKKVIGLKAEEVEFNKLTPDSIKGNVDLQKNVVRNYLKRTTKYNDARIEKEVKRLEDLEELEEESIANAAELKTIVEDEQKTIREAAKAKEKERTDNAIAQRNDLQKYIKETKTIIPEINLTDGEKKEIENLIFNPVAKDANGNPVFYLQKLFNDNPKEMSVKINYLAAVTKGFTDWSKLIKKAETKVSKKVETLLQTAPPKSKKSNTTTENDSWKDNLRRIQR